MFESGVGSDFDLKPKPEENEQDGPKMNEIQQ